jgi:hypothetical protein
MALWTLAEQQQIRPLDKNSTNKFNQLQLEVESNDIVKYLGFEFYQELKRNTSTYATLLDGGSYELNGYTYEFKGLKHVFSYLLYARYVAQSSIIDTPSGFVQHSGDNFQRISSGELKNQEGRYTEIAGTLWDECLRYLYTLQIAWFPIKSTTKNRISWL